MSFFTKELTPEQHQAEMLKLQQQIERQKKKNELLKAQNELRAEEKKYQGENKFGKFLSAIGDMGANVKSNLDKEYTTGVKFNQDAITSGLPTGSSKGSKAR